MYRKMYELFVRVDKKMLSLCQAVGTPNCQNTTEDCRPTVIMRKQASLWETKADALYTQVHIPTSAWKLQVGNLDSTKYDL